MKSFFSCQMKPISLNTRFVFAHFRRGNSWKFSTRKSPEISIPKSFNRLPFYFMMIINDSQWRHRQTIYQRLVIIQFYVFTSGNFLYTFFSVIKELNNFFCVYCDELRFFAAQKNQLTSPSSFCSLSIRGKKYAGEVFFFTHEKKLSNFIFSF